MGWSGISKGMSDKEKGETPSWIALSVSKEKDGVHRLDLDLLQKALQIFSPKRTIGGAGLGAASR